MAAGRSRGGGRGARGGRGKGRGRGGRSGGRSTSRKNDLNVNKNDVHTTTSIPAPLDATSEAVSDSMNECAGQMHTIHQSIDDNNIISSAPRNFASSKLYKLQAKVNAGLQCLDNMNMALKQLAGQANIAQNTLEEIKMDLVDAIQEQEDSNGAAVVVQPKKEVITTQMSSELKLARQKEPISSAAKENQHPALITPKSDEIVDAALVNLINAHSKYINGSPTSYIAWLQNELDIVSVADLQECIYSYMNEVGNIDVLERGDNGHIWIKSGMEGEFWRSVLGSGGGEQRLSDQQTKDKAAFTQRLKDSSGGYKPTSDKTNASDKEAAPVTTIIPSNSREVEPPPSERKVEDNAVKSMTVPSDQGGNDHTPSEKVRVIPSNNKPSENRKEHAKLGQSQADAKRVRAVQKALEATKLEESQQAEAERVRAAELATESKRRAEQEKEAKRVAKEEKKQRAKEERQARAAAKLKQKEDAKKAAEAEKQRQLEAMKSSVTERPSKKSVVVSLGASSNAKKSAVISSGASASRSNDKNATSKRTDATTTTSQPSKRKEFVLETTRLSTYLKAMPETTADDISSIFALLQNENTLETGRKLIRLECMAKERLSELDKAMRQSKEDTRMLDKITAEENEFAIEWPNKSADLKQKINQLCKAVAAM